MTATPATPTPATGGTLADVVRSAAAPPSVVVLDVAHDITNTPWKGPLKLDEDLWLSTADGRFNSPIIPVYVGEEGSAVMQTFYVRIYFFLTLLCIIISFSVVQPRQI
jgi:hypothetical protein